MTKYFAWILALCLLLTLGWGMGSGNVTDARASEAPDGPKVVVLGDSIAEGYGLASADEAFPNVLQGLLRASGFPHAVVINAGISGSTSASGPSRVKWQVQTRPDWLVLELGANDGLRGSSVAEMRKNLSETIKISQAAGVRVLLASMKIPTNYGDQYRADFESAFRQVARETGVALIPFLLDGVAGVPRLNQADGIHPVAEGQRIVAQNVLRRLLPLLRASNKKAGPAK